MFHRNLERPVATHRYAAYSTSSSRGSRTVRRFDHRYEFRDDGILPSLHSIARVRVEAGSSEWNRHNEFADLSVGDHPVQHQVGLSPGAPPHLVLVHSMKEIEDGIPFGRIVIRRRQI